MFELRDFLVDYADDGVNYRLSADHSYADSRLGGVVSVVTNEPFLGVLAGSGEPVYPTYGNATITGGDDNLYLDANTGDAATVYLNLNGGEWKATVPWNELEAWA